jgi:homogentisate 1,2-dioxygenase
MESSDIFANLKYQKGFGNGFHTEAKEGAVPEGRFKGI